MLPPLTGVRACVKSLPTAQHALDSFHTLFIVRPQEGGNVCTRVDLMLIFLVVVVRLGAGFIAFAAPASAIRPCVYASPRLATLKAAIPRN